MASPLQGYPHSISSGFPEKFTSTHLYSWVERDTVRGKCLSHEHITLTLPGLEPRPLDSELSALTIEPLHLYLYLLDSIVENG